MLKAIDFYFLETSFNIGFTYIPKEEGEDGREIHLFCGICAFVFIF